MRRFLLIIMLLGVGAGVVDQTQKSPEEMQDRANQVINKIMKSFPPN